MARPSRITSNRIPEMAFAAAVVGHHHQVSDSDSDSEHGGGSNPLRHLDLSASIFRPYFDFTGQSTATATDLSKIQSFLTSSASGALSCLICLERIRISDPTWSCSAVCFSVFHLVCIQSWARQASDLAATRATTRLSLSPAAASESATWHCPKCRSEYTKSEIPKSYLCFCGKLENPSSDDPWILPHSCGEICDRPLRNNCGHSCLLLCHPGPCPPCPKVVQSTCFCGSVTESRRCEARNFACSGTCSKVLDCGAHRCIEKCHDGPCPPCRKRGIYKCQCRKTEEDRECCERIFRCKEPCNKVLECGKHKCSKGCHSGECGDCPFRGKRSCPCGKRVYEGMACDVAVPLCGGTCDKLLSCGYHQCPERCHRGPCIETCRLVLTKSCRCRSLRKEVKKKKVWFFWLCLAMTLTEIRWSYRWLHIPGDSRSLILEKMHKNGNFSIYCWYLLLGTTALRFSFVKFILSLANQLENVHVSLVHLFCITGFQASKFKKLHNSNMSI